MSAPFVSVLLPVFNGEPYLDAALASIKQQEPLDQLEVLLVDDASTDNTLAVAERYAGEMPLRLVEGPRLRNWVPSANAALRQARGRFISLFNHDDLWEPHRLQRMRALSDQYPGARFLASATSYVDAEGRPCGIEHLPFRRATLVPQRDALRALLVQNFLPAPVPMADRELVRSIGLDNTLPYSADWKLWLGVAAATDLAVVPEPLIRVRIDRGSLTFALARRPEVFRAQFEQVLSAFLTQLDPGDPDDARWTRAARLSVEVNMALGLATSGNWQALGCLARACGYAVDPRVLRRYLRYSRIVDRASARVRALL